MVSDDISACDRCILYARPDSPRCYLPFGFATAQARLYRSPIAPLPSFLLSLSHPRPRWSTPHLPHPSSARSPATRNSRQLSPSSSCARRRNPSRKRAASPSPSQAALSPSSSPPSSTTLPSSGTDGTPLLPLPPHRLTIASDLTFVFLCVMHRAHPSLSQAGLLRR